MKKVFVTDGISPATPAIIESLKRNGYYTVCGEEFKWNTSFFSKFCNKRIIYPSVENDKDKFLKFMIDFIKVNEIEYFIPVRCPIIEIVLQNREKFDNITKILLPNYNSWLIAEYKHKTLELAYSIGLSIPKTIFDNNIPFENIKEQLGIPFIIKVSRSSGARGVKKISNEIEFKEIKKDLDIKKQQYFFQEYIKINKSFNASYIFDTDNNCKASFLMEKVRQYPINAGSTSYAKFAINNDLVQEGRRLLEKLNWVGVAEIEYVEDLKDGNIKLLEINPRFWNPTLLAIKSGINFPKYIIDLLNNENIDMKATLNKEVTFTFLPYEILNFVSSPQLSKLRSLIPWGDNYDVFFRYDDLSRFLGFIVQSIYLILTKYKKFIKR